MKHFILDYDGVVTNNKAITDPQVVKQLVQLARKGHKIDLATGRPMRFLETDFLPHLRKLTQAFPHLRDSFILSAENGLEIARFKRGKKKTLAAIGKGVAAREITLFRRILAKHRFKNITFDKDKQHMFTMYATTKQLYSNPDAVQSDLDRAEVVLKDAVKSTPHLSVRRTLYAVDVIDPTAEKHLVGERALKEARLDTHFVVVGDAASDLLLAKPIHHAGRSYEFHFVGHHDQLSDKVARQVIGSHKIIVHRAAALHNEGTRLVLNKHLR